MCVIVIPIIVLLFMKCCICLSSLKDLVHACIIATQYGIFSKMNHYSISLQNVITDRGERGKLSHFSDFGLWELN